MASRGSAAADTLHTLVRRCVECPPTQPSCPTCAQDETCSLIPQSCDTCASTTCVKIGSLPGQTAPQSSTPIGPIVGGVIGGVAAIVIGVFLVWFFCIRNKRRKDTWEPPEKRDQSTLARADSRTHSMASTVLTRASNVIQIAYIPGVTGRSPPESPGIPPPMPSFPRSTATNSANNTPQLEQHFFMPSDLRDSTWSDTSSVDPRISMAPSLARASVATTIYRNDAIVPPIPAQHAFRAQANVVSVKSGSSTPGTGATTTPGAQTPPIPHMPKALNINNSSIVARHVMARPIEVKKSGSAKQVPTLATLAQANSRKSTAQDSSEKSVAPYYEEKEVAFSPGTDIEDSPSSPSMKHQASFASMDTASTSGVSAVMPADGPIGSGPTHRRTASDGLTAMIEDAINRAAQDAAHSPRPALHKQDSGPFSDVNEVKEDIP